MNQEKIQIALATRMKFLQQWIRKIIQEVYWMWKMMF